jgi:hypothetical protein
MGNWRLAEISEAVTTWQFGAFLCAPVEEEYYLSKYNVYVIRLFCYESVITSDQPPTFTITIKSTVVIGWSLVVNLCPVV